MVIVMILWIGNDVVLKSSSQWQLNDSWTDYLIFKILLIVIDWNF